MTDGGASSTRRVANKPVAIDATRPIAPPAAAIAASVLAGVIATRVFGLPWEPDWALAAAGGAVGLVASLATGLFATRRVLDAPPSVTLRQLQQ